MRANQEAFEQRVEQACRQACQAIAPAWPLDRAIAVNPHWGRIDRPLPEVAARMALLGGVRVYPSRDEFRRAWQSGRIREADLRAAVAMQGDARYADSDSCLAALARDNTVQPLPLLIDLLDSGPAQRHHLPWRQAITHQVSQTCAAYFDQHQADWQPQRDAGLYAFWRDTLQHDHGIGILMGLPQLGRQLANLPATPEAAERWVLDKLGLPHEVWADYLEAILLTVNGWASWCAYLHWQANLDGGEDRHLRELLAIRLAWGAILLDGLAPGRAEAAFTTLRQGWQGFAHKLNEAHAAFALDALWQQALEAGYQAKLAARLCGTRVAPVVAPITVQAAFCIDVRSEPLRRALEAADPTIQTIGFAGFFGLPIAYAPLGSSASRPQLPGLLAPAMQVEEQLLAPAAYEGPVPARERLVAQRQQGFRLSQQWQAASRWPAAAFSFVEAFGWAYGGKLAGWLRQRTQLRQRDDLAGLPAGAAALCRPTLGHLPLASRVDLAKRVLGAMGLNRQLAPLVLLVGHGSQSSNNPHAAALDCGACCGQTGEVNARVLALLLNDAALRDGLLAEGIHIPQHTVFVAALHNTTTDELEYFDRDLLPEYARSALAHFELVSQTALRQVRQERAPRLGLADMDDAALLAALHGRASDGAQTRPEWGLAGNAAFIIAPRSLSRGLRLDGRSFLHDYDASQDADGSLLELLMTAPMLVTHWINWQYHASQCEPRLYGCGNKLLHNVVGGHIGVFEGNGGDLRIGLSQQSLHDGECAMHEPLRLTVVIAAPQSRIDAIVAKHRVVRQLIEHGWLHLWQLEGGSLARRVDGRWQTLNWPDQEGYPPRAYFTQAGK
ncbi:YbcC family protein [Chitinimonas sp.]|uniref:YbcC family protein n=1 Tax=Chitinimonas sp. TaxID=1934313 RepID=UPI0035B00684